MSYTDMDHIWNRHGRGLAPPGTSYFTINRTDYSHNGAVVSKTSLGFQADDRTDPAEIGKAAKRLFSGGTSASGRSETKVHIHHTISKHWIAVIKVAAMAPQLKNRPARAWAWKFKPQKTNWKETSHITGTAQGEGLGGFRPPNFSKKK